MQKASILIISLIIHFISASAQNNAKIAAFTQNKSLLNAGVSICIQDMEGNEIMSFNKKQSLTPASTLKIITTATALEVLGNQHRFKTELAVKKDSNNTIVIRGWGDPTLGSGYITSNSSHDFLDEWINAIKKQIKPSALNIIVDDSYFGYKGVSRKWIREDMGNYYAAGSYGISILDNTYKLFFNTKNKESRPEIIKTDPHIPGLTFINTLELNTTGNDNGYIIGEPFSYKRLLTGDIPSGRSLFSIKGDIPDPGLFLGHFLADRLKIEGFGINNVSTTRINSENNNSFETEASEIFYTHYSVPLSTIIRVVNVRSNNHYAEHLIREIGKHQNKTSKNAEPLVDGIKSIKSWWEEKGIDTSGLFMYDGCGLSPSNAVNSEFMCNVLRYMYTKSKYSDTFIASFPKAGQEGTVRNLLKGTRLEGKAYIKSGSIANVQCYAGYIIDGQKKYVFSVIVNNFKQDSRREIIKAIETLLLN
ncbi:D-alanyl-D-alanine carboxypeptidase/D-alanyl-D-alanine-endopeptidase [Dysgonomonas sp. 216]|uniref:D-alanyl-D-alanine carboxypeptidase/D-alanyl-D-alanine endopeptidase n=1 Tax=Dysgonomonas sp. 216 TaxID=2302934 RepID=UPI0013D0C668|nr:D-alanyl-D-alanine carboxypeptidase/D-alanyl-D-alanine-endopeptidase [Dysgonomonas sp. 216]NDW18940.1 D-alanyl-D-alanine carboxypeptidase/D-alanyl-D-alanine-endopeptidase [Dysgonomonas sp. 216]